MKQFILFLALVLTLVQGRSITAFKYCKAQECSTQEEKCAIERSGCMVSFKAYFDCIKSDSVCTELDDGDSFGECWTKCRQESSSSLYKEVQSCYEECGAAENGMILSSALGILALCLFTMINI